uniref:7TM_GPCR_Srx domain-containing protein n=1 Tax=Panagrellus redivivus TaxID=6233 RepID=A0A7E4ULK2_PANRE
MDTFTTLDFHYYLCGCIMTVLPAVYLSLYGIILYLIQTRKSQYNAPVYTLLFHMGLSDVIQLTGFCIGGICILLQYDIPFVLNKILGAFTNCAMLSWIAFSFSISMNRFITFCYPKYDSVFYSEWRLKLQLAACWAAMAPSLLICFSKYCTVKFYRQKLAWSHDPDTLLAHVLRMYDLYYATFMLALSLIMYGLIIIGIKMMIKVSDRTTRYEVRVFIQAVCLCVYTTLVQLHWYFRDYYMPESKYLYFLSNLIGVFNCGMNPMLCLTLNLTVRATFIEFIGANKRKTCTVTIVQSSRIQ